MAYSSELENSEGASAKALWSKWLIVFYLKDGSPAEARLAEPTLLLLNKQLSQINAAAAEALNLFKYSTMGRCETSDGLDMTAVHSWLPIVFRVLNRPQRKFYVDDPYQPWLLSELYPDLGTACADAVREIQSKLVTRLAPPAVFHSEPPAATEAQPEGDGSIGHSTREEILMQLPDAERNAYASLKAAESIAEKVFKRDDDAYNYLREELKGSGAYIGENGRYEV